MSKHRIQSVKKLNDFLINAKKGKKIKGIFFYHLLKENLTSSLQVPPLRQGFEAQSLTFVSQ